jgi:hypothetical protein
VVLVNPVVEQLDIPGFGGQALNIQFDISGRAGRVVVVMMPEDYAKGTVTTSCDSIDINDCAPEIVPRN